MDERCDAIVVGAGPAGSAMAILLARGGWDTVLVDAASFPRAKVCGECLSAAAWPVLRDLGIEQQVRETAVVQRSLRIVLPRGAALELALADDAAEGVVGISRRQLDWLLLEQARASGARLLLEHRVRRIVFEGDRVAGVEIVASTASRERERPEPCTLRGHVVIAADGRSSTIVRETGRVFARGPRLVGFKRHRVCEGTQGWPDVINMVSFPGGYIGTCEVEEQEQNICGLLPREAVRQARGSIDVALTNLLRGYDREICSFDAPSTENHWMTMPDVRQQRALPQVEGVLYVGDALGTIEPLAGQGLAMALAGASLAAELLLTDPRPNIDAAWQRRYVSIWRSRFGRTIDRAQRLGWLLRRPALLYPLARLAPASTRLEDLLFRASYRATRLRAW